MNIFVIVATYNERENLEKLIPEIFATAPEVNLLIVDDNSPDGTAELVKELKQRFPQLHLLSRPQKLGYGTAFIEGFDYALNNGAEGIITMDADFSHDPGEITHLFEKLKNADVVIGSRYINGIRILNWPLRRLMLSAFANKYVNLVLQIGIKDCTSGYRCYRSEVLKKINYRRIKSRGYAFLVEILYLIKTAGFKVIEYPIIYTERREGQSKMSKALFIESFFRPLLLRLGRLFSRITR